MSNRKQRRAKVTKEETVYKASGLSEETLQNRLNNKGEWKPTSSVTVTEEKERKAPWTARRAFNILSWVLIALSVVGFFVAMWMPRMWLIVTVSVLFAVGVFSLFFTTGKEGSNTLLDANGTAR